MNSSGAFESGRAGKGSKEALVWKSGPDALISCYSDRERVICGTQRSLLVNRSAVSRTRSLSSVIFPRMTVCCLPDANGERCRTFRWNPNAAGAVGREARNFGLSRSACNRGLRTECIGKSHLCPKRRTKKTPPKVYTRSRLLRIIQRQLSSRVRPLRVNLLR